MVRSSGSHSLRMWSASRRKHEDQMVKGLEWTSYEEELRTLDLSSLENGKDDPMAPSRSPKKGSAKQVVGLFSLASSDRTPENALNCNFAWPSWSKKTTWQLTAHCNDTASDAEFHSFFFFSLYPELKLIVHTLYFFFSKIQP